MIYIYYYYYFIYIIIIILYIIIIIIFIIIIIIIIYILYHVSDTFIPYVRTNSCDCLGFWTINISKTNAAGEFFLPSCQAQATGAPARLKLENEPGWIVRTSMYMGSE